MFGFFFWMSGFRGSREVLWAFGRRGFGVLGFAGSCLRGCLGFRASGCVVRAVGPRKVTDCLVCHVRVCSRTFSGGWFPL